MQLQAIIQWSVILLLSESGRSQSWIWRGSSPNDSVGRLGHLRPESASFLDILPKTTSTHKNEYESNVLPAEEHDELMSTNLLNVRHPDSIYGLIQEVLPRPAPRGKILNHDLGGLHPDEVWMAEGNMLVLRGGGMSPHQETQPPLDIFEAPANERLIGTRYPFLSRMPKEIATTTPRTAEIHKEPVVVPTHHFEPSLRLSISNLGKNDNVFDDNHFHFLPYVPSSLTRLRTTPTPSISTASPISISGFDQLLPLRNRIRISTPADSRSLRILHPLRTNSLLNSLKESYF